MNPSMIIIIILVVITILTAIGFFYLHERGNSHPTNVSNFRNSFGKFGGKRRIKYLKK